MEKRHTLSFTSIVRLDEANKEKSRAKPTMQFIELSNPQRIARINIELARASRALPLCSHIRHYLSSACSISSVQTLSC